MPSVKVCLWNIQNFGQISPKYDGTDYVSGNGLRNQFIARFLKRHDIDVLMIQECTPFCGSSFQDLQRKANAVYVEKDWAYSWCGSTISSADTASARMTFDVGLTSGARSEGYGVLWRRSQDDRFTVVDGLFPIAISTGPASANLTSPLNMSELGRPTGVLRDGYGRNTFGALGGFTLASAFPYQLNKDTGRNDLLAAWPSLNYPPTAATDHTRLKWAGSRRPAYVVLKLGGDVANLCPVAAYHAPSNQQRSAWGAFIAGLSREMYATNVVNGNVPDLNNLRVVRKAVFGGDFNWSESNDNWPGEYRYFTQARAQTYTGGASSSVAPPGNASQGQRRTTVQILDGDHSTPIESDDPDDYLRHKIDLAFFPSGSGITATRIDLLDEVINYTSYETPIKGAFAVMNNAELDVGRPSLFVPRRMTTEGPQEERYVERDKKWVRAFVPMISGAWGGTFVDWNESCRQFKAGDISDARRAAEFIHMFISDHMPLVATIPV